MKLKDLYISANIFEIHVILSQNIFEGLFQDLPTTCLPGRGQFRWGHAFSQALNAAGG